MAANNMIAGRRLRNLKERERKASIQEQQSFLAEKSLYLQKLIDTSFKKIDELKDLIDQESSLVGVDLTEQVMSPTLFRQEEVTFRALRYLERLQSVENGVGHDEVQPRSIPNSVATLKGHNSMGKDMGRVVADKESWYGSLDRNVTRKKKRALLDTKRYTKMVGSMATLELDRDLKPDEQYEVGLPSLAEFKATLPQQRRLDMLINHHSKIQPSKYQQDSHPIIPPHQNDSFLQMRDPSLSARASTSSYNHLRPSTASLMGLGDGRRGNKEIIEIEGSRALPNLPQQSHTRSSSCIESAEVWNNKNVGFYGPPNPPLLPIPAVVEHFQHTVPIPETSFSSGFEETESGDGSLLKDTSNNSSDSKTSFANESTKPFEMSDYYKYSSKFRKQKSASTSSDLLDPLSTTSHDFSFLVNSARPFEVSVGPPKSQPNDNHCLPIPPKPSSASKLKYNHHDLNGNDETPPPPPPELPPKHNRRVFQQPPPQSTLTIRANDVDGDIAWVMDRSTIV